MGYWLRLTLIIIPLLWLAPVSAAEKVVLQLRWHHQPQFAGYYMAQAKGFYRDAGLDVSIRAGDGNHIPVVEVNEGKAQFGVGNMEVFTLWAEGYPFIALAAIYQHSPNVLIARGDRHITSLADLAGRKVMLFPGDLNPEIMAMLTKAGIKGSDLQRVTTSTDIQAFITGKVDAFSAYLTNEPYLLDQLGVSYRIFDPHAMGMDFYSDLLFTSRQYLLKHPKTVAAFRAASLKGWNYALDHPEETLQVIRQRYQLTQSEGHMRFEFDTAQQLIMADMINLGTLNLRRLKHIARQLYQTGQIPRVSNIADFVYQPSQTVRPHWPWMLLSGLLLLSSTILAWRWQKNRIRLHRLSTKLAKVEHRRDHDPITGMPTRPRFCRVLNREPQRAWLAIIHIDNLEQLNHSRGISAADDKLKALAERLQRELLPGDMLARGDGPRLLLYLRADNHPMAEQFVNELQRQLGQALELPLSVITTPINPSVDLGHQITIAEEQRLARQQGF